jgi:signal transduction histidine kinase
LIDGQMMKTFFLQENENRAPGFNLFRFFSLTSFASIAVTAILLALLFRQVVIPQIIQHSQTTSQTVAQTLLGSYRSELDGYLASAETASSGESGSHEPSARLSVLFKEILRESSVVRIKLYNRQGIVVLSTDHRQLGDNRFQDAGFTMAESGRVASNFIHRNTATSFEKEIEHDNLMETYVPVRASPGGPVRGVLEIYTDMNHVVSRNDQIVFSFVAGAALILLGHFVVLLVAARRAGNIVKAEQRAHEGRTSGLETLAAELLNSEDAEKRRIATDLHEELAQTLSAIKINFERSREHISAGKDNGGALESTVPALQDALKLVRGIATRLWPFSLEALGLLPTIVGFCDEFERRHPEIRIDQDISLNERDVPQPLKIVIYRIIESALRSFMRYGDAEIVTLSLRRSEETVTLEIDAVATRTSYASAAGRTADPALNTRFSTVQERATLSGGTFLASRGKGGGITLLATWKV